METSHATTSQMLLKAAARAELFREGDDNMVARKHVWRPQEPQVPQELIYLERNLVGARENDLILNKALEALLMEDFSQRSIQECTCRTDRRKLI